MADRIMFRVGTARGRKHSKGIKVNDVIDFWRVERITNDEHLLLRAEMQVPGPGLSSRQPPAMDEIF